MSSDHSSRELRPRAPGERPVLRLRRERPEREGAGARVRGGERPLVVAPREPVVGLEVRQGLGEARGALQMFRMRAEKISRR